MHIVLLSRPKDYNAQNSDSNIPS